MEDTSSAVNSAPASSGPTTFAEAFAADASPASDPSTQSNDATAAVQPTTDGEVAAPATDDDRSPFIPRPRFDEVNSKLHELKTWKEQYAWAEQVNRDELAEVSRIAQKYQGDKIGFVQELIAELQQDPTVGPQLRSMAARALQQGRGQSQPDVMPQPDVTITDGQGNPVGQTYSAEGLAKRDAWLRQQMLAEIRKEFEPVTNTVQRVEAERQTLAAQSFASGTFEQLSKLPGFTDAAPEIGKRLAAMKLQTDDPQVLTLAVKAIYADVVTPKREAELSSKAQSQLLDNLQQKAAASSSVNPGSAAPATTKTITSFHDKSLQW